MSGRAPGHDAGGRVRSGRFYRGRRGQGDLIQQQPPGRWKFLVRKPDLHPYRIARREIEPRAEICVGRQELRAE